MLMKLGERRVKFSGTLTAKFNERVSWGVVEDMPPDVDATAAVTIATPWGGSVAFDGPRWLDVTVGNPHPIGYADFNLGWELSADTGFGSSETTTYWHTTNYRVLDGNYYDWTASPTGSWEISVDVEIMAEITYDAWNGYEAPPRTQEAIFERTRVGGTATASITLGGGTLAKTSTVSTHVVIGYGLSLNASVQSINTTGSASASAQFMDRGSLSAPYSRSYNSCTAGANAISVTTPNTTSPKTATAAHTLSPDRAYASEAQIRRMNESFGTIDLEVDRYAGAGQSVTLTATGGALSDSYTQKRYTCSSVLDGVTQSGLSLDEWSGIEIRLKTTALSASGDDMRDRRVMWRCHPPYAAFNLQQNSSVDVDTCGSLTPGGTSYAGVWSAVENCVVSVSGGIFIAVAGGTGRVRRTFAPDWGGFGGYRYLAIKIGSTGSAASFAVEITDSANQTKRWTTDYQGAALMAANGAPDWVLLDLCAPSSASAGSDGKDARWPLPTTDSDYWGVTNAAKMEITNLAPNTNYTIAEVELFRRVSGWSDVWFLPAFDDWNLEQTNTVGEVTTETYVRVFLDGDTEGRRSLMLSDCIKTVQTSSGGSSTSYTSLTLQNLHDGINSQPGNPALEGQPAHPGWVASNLAATVDPSEGAPIADWMNALRPAVWAWGAGGYWGKTGSDTSYQWHWGLQLDCRTVRVIYAQPVVDRITEWPPDSGDLFRFLDAPNNGRDDGPLICRAAAILRGDGCGIVLDESGYPLDQADVTATDITMGVSAGSATTEERGVYETDTPFGRGDHSVRVSVEGASYSRVWHNRRRHRACLRSIARLWKCVEVDSARQWLHVGDGKRIRTYYLASPPPMTLAFSSAEYAGVDSWSRLRCEPRRGRLYLLGRSGGAAPYTWRLYASDDGGLTGEERLTMTARTAVIERDSERGYLIALWENSGNVLRQVSQDGGVTWSAAAAILVDGSPAAGEILDITQDRRRGAMAMVLKSATTQVLISFDSGATWTQALS